MSEFDSYGQFIEAWGWGVADGAAKLEACGPGASPPTATCRQGLPGTGAGQFDNPRGGIAVDSNGDVWVGDLANHRVEKFSPAGEFLLMVGGEVDKGPNHPGNVCSAAYIAEGDACGTGVPGPGAGAFESEESFGTSLTAGVAGSVFVGDVGRIEEVAADGSVNSQIALESPYASKYVDSIDRTAAGSFYVTLAPNNGDPNGSPPENAVRKVDPAGTVTASILTPVTPTALTLDVEGDLFVALSGETTNGHGYYREVIEYGPTGEALIPPGEGFASRDELDKFAQYFSGMASDVVTASGASDIYLTEGTEGTEGTIASLNAYGPAPDKWEPPKAAPQIVSQYARSITDSSAEIGAEINPHLWSDTTYSVEYGIGRCSEGGCPQSLPVSAAALGGGIVNVPVATEGIELSGLMPNTVYHFRFTAQSAGGGPVTGVGEAEAEATFRTSIPVAPDTNCPNQAFRTGEAATLPDCRAYEMVSPVDKNGADIFPLPNYNGLSAALDESSATGEKLTYSDYQAFGDASGSPYVSQYIANRGPDGWETVGITPPQGISALPPSKRLEIEFWDFTPDLCTAALVNATEPVTAAGATGGYRNAYLSHNCGADSYETLSTAPPAPGSERLFYVPAPQGLSTDGRCAVLGTYGFGGVEVSGVIYESCEGTQETVSILPTGAPATDARVGSVSGTTMANLKPRIGTVATAVSSDGSTVYWSEVEGKLLVRVNADQEQSALRGSTCTEEEKACTKRVSQTVSGARAKFLAAAADGSKAFFYIEQESSPLSGNVYEFDLASGTSQKVAGDFVGFVGASTDASRMVFASSEVLTSVPNSSGSVAVAGEPNLYYYDAERSGDGRFRFVATLSAKDAEVNVAEGQASVSPIALESFRKVSRLSGDGEHLTFMSNADLTGYDNTDQNSGQPDDEVYLYNADANSGAGQLLCVSCNPSGQRPAGRQVPVEGKPGNWAAALLPPYATEFYGSRVISEGGNRVYFDSYEPLVAADSNGKEDVYEWEAVGSGDCVEGGSGYDVYSGGCISLISTGKSPVDSEFIDASADGKDVFFATNQSLVEQDPGQYDIYDAREDGGFPAQPIPPTSCTGEEACQAAQAPPALAAPVTGAHGPGNSQSQRPSCGKGRRAVKKHRRWRCIEKASKKKHGKKRRHQKNGKNRSDKDRRVPR